MSARRSTVGGRAGLPFPRRAQVRYYSVDRPGSNRPGAHGRQAARPGARTFPNPLRHPPPNPLGWAIAGQRIVRPSAHERPARTRSRAALPWYALWAGASFTAIALLTATALLLSLEWLLFDTPLVARRLPLIDETSPSGKLLLADRYRDAEVLYLGDSRILYGIDPNVVSEECDCGPGFNAAFAAPDARLTRIMAERTLKKLSPELVVIGVSQWELSDEADIHVWGPAPELVAPWRWAEFGLGLDQPDEVRDAVGAAWRTYHHRSKLRVALDPWSEDAGRTDPRRGFDAWRGRPQLREDDLEERQEQWFSNFSVHGHRSEALRGLLADLRGRGIQVLLVAPPLHPDFHARVRREVDRFRAATSELAAENGAVFEDLSEARRSDLTEGNFRDVVHLNERATKKFSREVAEAIESHFAFATD
jgi:hypothetical protein